MSRSIHTTSKDLKRERVASVRDDVPSTSEMTELEKEDISKRIYKVNAERRRQTEMQNAPAWKEMKLTNGGIVLRVKKRRIEKS